MTYPYQACSNCAAASFESASVRFTKAKLTPYGVRKFDQFFLRSAIRWGVLAKRAKKPEVSTTIRKRAFEAWAFSLSSAIKRPWTSVSGVEVTAKRPRLPFAHRQESPEAWCLHAERQRRYSGNFPDAARKQISEFRPLPFPLKDKKTE